MPFRAVARLRDDYQHEGRQQGKEHFTRPEDRKRFVGGNADRYRIKLDFDPGTGLLSILAVVDEADRRLPVSISYEDYRQVQGVPVPHLITRRIGGRVERILRVESIVFQPDFPAGEFDLADPAGGGR